MSETISMNDLKVMYDEVKGTVDSYNEMLSTLVESINGLTMDIVEPIKKLELEDIDKMSLEEFISIKEKACPTNTELFDELYEDAEDKLAFYKQSFTEIRNSITDVEKANKDLAEIEESMQNISKECYDYLNSEEYLNKQKEEVQALSDKLKDMESTYQKHCTQDMIDAMKSTYDLSFILNRIYDDEGNVNGNEIKSIVGSFFDPNRSRAIMNKYYTKCAKLGINSRLYQSFNNIEEMFLPKKYWIYNNLFLFGFIRYVSYVDCKKSDKIIIGSYMGLFAKLIYHKFTSPELETNAIELIQKYVDAFEEYSDKFTNDNKLSPLHPSRLTAESAKREELFTKLKDNNIEYGEYMTTNELLALVNDHASEIYKPDEEPTLDIENPADVEQLVEDGESDDKKYDNRQSNKDTDVE